MPVCWLVFKTSEGRKTVLVGSTPTLFRHLLRSSFCTFFLANGNCAGQLEIMEYLGHIADLFSVMLNFKTKCLT